MAGTAGRKQDAPKAGVGGGWPVVGLAEPDVRVLPGKQYSVGVDGGWLSLSRLLSVDSLEAMVT